MTIPSSTRNPSDDYPPTRPPAILVIIVLCLIVAVLGVENWRDVSSFAHVAQIEKALGP
jgi:hypothetical protein